jgi:hypothetical protein
VISQQRLSRLLDRIERVRICMEASNDDASDLPNRYGTQA